MSQDELLTFLRWERAKSEDFYTMPEIRGILVKKGWTCGKLVNLGHKLRQLAFFNEIEMKLIGHIGADKPGFRAKKKAKT